MNVRDATTRMPESACLNCHKPLSGATQAQLQNVEPKPNDLTVCLYCGHLMVFADDLTLRAPTDAEMLVLAGHPEMIEAQRNAKNFRRLRRLVETAESAAWSRFSQEGTVGSPAMLYEMEDGGGLGVLVMPDLADLPEQLTMPTIRGKLRAARACRAVLMMEAWMLPDSTRAEIDEWAGRIHEHPRRVECVTYSGEDKWGGGLLAMQKIRRPTNGKPRLEPLDFEPGWRQAGGRFTGFFR